MIKIGDKWLNLYCKVMKYKCYCFQDFSWTFDRSMKTLAFKNYPYMMNTPKLAVHLEILN